MWHRPLGSILVGGWRSTVNTQWVVLGMLDTLQHVHRHVQKRKTLRRHHIQFSNVALDFHVCEKLIYNYEFRFKVWFIYNQKYDCMVLIYIEFTGIHHRMNWRKNILGFCQNYTKLFWFQKVRSPRVALWVVVESPKQHNRISPYL